MRAAQEGSRTCVAALGLCLKVQACAGARVDDGGLANDEPVLYKLADVLPCSKGHESRVRNVGKGAGQRSSSHRRVLRQRARPVRRKNQSFVSENDKVMGQQPSKPAS